MVCNRRRFDKFDGTRFITYYKNEIRNGYVLQEMN